MFGYSKADSLTRFNFLYFVYTKLSMQSFDIYVYHWHPMFYKDTNTRPKEYKETLPGKREKEQSFEISIRSWYTPQQYSTENQWNSIKCVTAICAISVNTDFYQVKFCILDEEIFAVFTYIMTSCKSSILLFTCNRKLRSTLVISLRGIGGSKKSRLLLSSKRPT